MWTRRRKRNWLELFEPHRLVLFVVVVVVCVFACILGVYVRVSFDLIDFVSLVGVCVNICLFHISITCMTFFLQPVSPPPIDSFASFPPLLLPSPPASPLLAFSPLRVPQEFFTEETRSRQPSVMSVVRSVVGLFFSPQDSHLGLYGAFGYDLCFQFEALRLKQQRPHDQRDVVLFLPDCVVAVDHPKHVRPEFVFRVCFFVCFLTPTKTQTKTNKQAESNPSHLRV